MVLNHLETHWDIFVCTFLTISPAKWELSIGKGTTICSNPPFIQEYYDINLKLIKSNPLNSTIEWNSGQREISPPFWRTCWIRIFFFIVKWEKKANDWCHEMHFYVYKMFCVCYRFKVAENREKHGQGNGQQKIREVSQRRREQANGVLRIPCSSEYGIESGILYFPLNYTSSEIHFEQFEILTSFLALALHLWQNK